MPTTDYMETALAPFTAAVEPIKSEVEAALASAQKVTEVSDDATARTAATEITRLKSVTKSIEASRKGFTSHLDRVKKAAIAYERRFTAPLQAETDRINGLSQGYLAKLAEEREAKERERREAEMIEAAQRQAAAEADSIITGDPLVVEPDVVEEAEKRTPLVSGVKARETWTFEVENPDEVPRRYCCPDEKAIREYMQACKQSGATIDQLSIPGVKFIKKITVI